MAGSPPGRGDTRVEEPTRLERTIARRVAESRATVPQVDLSAEVDASALVELHRAARGRLSLTALLVRACALALRDVPRANGAYRDGRFEFYSRINVGVAVPAAEAYSMPTLFEADRRSAEVLSVELRALAQRAATGELTSAEQSGATFTLANIGALSVTSSTIAITPPHAGALCAGAIRELAAVHGDALAPSRALTLTLACDHRILYGAHAAGFLTRVKQLLEVASLLAQE